jgi:hypothetical protein
MLELSRKSQKLQNQTLEVEIGGRKEQNCANYRPFFALHANRHNSNCISHNLNWNAIKTIFPPTLFSCVDMASQPANTEQHFNSIMENQFLFTCINFLLVFPPLPLTSGKYPK